MQYAPVMPTRWVLARQAYLATICVPSKASKCRHVYNAEEGRMVRRPVQRSNQRPRDKAAEERDGADSADSAESGHVEPGERLQVIEAR
jgi:hypothetical protein